MSGAAVFPFPLEKYTSYGEQRATLFLDHLYEVSVPAKLVSISDVLEKGLNESSFVRLDIQCASLGITQTLYLPFSAFRYFCGLFFKTKDLNEIDFVHPYVETFNILCEQFFAKSLKLSCQILNAQKVMLPLSCPESFLKCMFTSPQGSFFVLLENKNLHKTYTALSHIGFRAFMAHSPLRLEGAFPFGVEVGETLLSGQELSRLSVGDIMIFDKTSLSQSSSFADRGEVRLGRTSLLVSITGARCHIL